jgi:DNA-binding NtrC family response regulator
MQTGLVTTGAKPRAVARSWICRVLNDTGTGSSAVLGARPLQVGADRSCDLILTDPQVSRKHAELSVASDGIRVRDLDSTNGTFCQGARISEIIVAAGSIVTFGGTQVQIESADKPTLPPSSRNRFGGMVGTSVAMRELYSVLEMASPTEVTVLIEGESGTGKELVARALHDHSARANVPLVVVDCSAIATELLDSQLFGHLRGAFTGASHDRKGAFVEASGGTLFLDELGELPLPSQAKLLRALEDQTVMPVGSDKRIKVDTRVVAATHRNLLEMVSLKRFRFDLYYRLAVVHAHLPPLRDRLEDIPVLIANFYEGRGIDPGPIEGPNLDRLMQNAWPGNIRELRNVLERAWALSGPDKQAFADLILWMQSTPTSPKSGPRVDASMPFKEAKEQWNDEFERVYLEQVFAQCSQNITHAAEHAGINRRHFRTLLRKHGIVD